MCKKQILFHLKVFVNYIAVQYIRFEMILSSSLELQAQASKVTGHGEGLRNFNES